MQLMILQLSYTYCKRQKYWHECCVILYWNQKFTSEYIQLQSKWTDIPVLPTTQSALEYDSYSTSVEYTYLLIHSNTEPY